MAVSSAAVSRSSRWRRGKAPLHGSGSQVTPQLALTADHLHDFALMRQPSGKVERRTRFDDQAFTGAGRFRAAGDSAFNGNHPSAAVRKRVARSDPINRVDQPEVRSIDENRRGIDDSREFGRIGLATRDPRRGVDILKWIEAIPFSETKGYVQRVIENSVVYDSLRPSAQQQSAVHVSRYLGKSRPG